MYGDGMTGIRGNPTWMKGNVVEFPGGNGRMYRYPPPRRYVASLAGLTQEIM